MCPEIIKAVDEGGKKWNENEEHEVKKMKIAEEMII